MSTPIDDFRIEKALDGQNKLAAIVNDLERQCDDALARLATVHCWIERNNPDGFINSQSHFQNLDRVADAWHDKLEAMREAIKEAHRFIRDIVKNHECGDDIDASGEAALAKLQPFLP